MQEPLNSNNQTRYIIRRLLDAIPGTVAVVSQKLIALLQDPSAFIKPTEDKSLQQIAHLLNHPETKALAADVIKETLALLRRSNLPSDLVAIVISHLTIDQLLRAMLLSKTWYRASLVRWRALLVSDFGVNPEVAKHLPNPHRVYHKIVYTLLSDNVIFSRFKKFAEKYGIDSFCFCSDISDYQKLEEFFKTNVIPALDDVVILGNVGLVKYFIESLNRIPNQKTFSKACASGSVPLVKYFMVDCNFKVPQPSLDDTSLDYNWLYPPDISEVLGNWDLLFPLLTYENLALTGSVELFNKRRPQRYSKLNRHDIFFDSKKVLMNAFRSRSLDLIKYLFEDDNSPMLKDTGALTDSQLLTSAVQCSSLAVVQYLFETKNMASALFSDSTKCNAFRSGSLTILKFLQPYLEAGVPKPTVSQLALYTENAIRSGSIRALKHACDNNLISIKASHTQNLKNAARVGLVAIFKFLLVEIAVSDAQFIFKLAMGAVFGSVMRHLVTVMNIQINPEILTQLKSGSFDSLRYLVEQRNIQPNDETIEKLNYQSYFSARYLKTIHLNKGRTSSFWTVVLSTKCKNAVNSIEHQILFDQQQQPQQWWSKPPLIRMFTRRYFTELSKDQSQDMQSKLLEITLTMNNILEIAKSAQLTAYPDNFVKQEQIYFTALKKIQIALEKALNDQSDDPKALAFYKHWQGFIEKIIFECSTLDESQKDEISRSQQR